ISVSVVVGAFGAAAGSDDLTGPVLLGDDGQAGGDPGVHAAGEVAGGLAVAGEQSGRDGGSAPGPADGDDRGVGRQLGQAVAQVGEGHMVSP
ncbi:MAG: hypothetical protein L0H41_09590, partial [Microlunatus sp.]|nr:hypothetical protein [Microlunatus sp.]